MGNLKYAGRYLLYIYTGEHIWSDKNAACVYAGQDFDQAVKEFNDACKRSKGEWGNYVFIGKSVKLLDCGMCIRDYEAPAK